MSDDDLFLSRLLIEPEPTPAELIAILYAMKPTAPDADGAPEIEESRWQVTARREALRGELDDRWEGWSQ